MASIDYSLSMAPEQLLIGCPNKPLPKEEKKCIGDTMPN